MAGEVEQGPGLRSIDLYSTESGDSQGFYWMKSSLLIKSLDSKKIGD
jgi:hypothetical protein